MKLSGTRSDAPPTKAHKEQSSLLTKAVTSLCPVCNTNIEAVIEETRDNRVFMFKRCSEHGKFKDLISSDAKFYKLIIGRDNARCGKVSNPIVKGQSHCPSSCGLCQSHMSRPVMLNIDLTNRCNLNCSICFANANAANQVIEVSMDQLKQMLDIGCAVDDVPAPCLQYSGGEPTMHPQFLEALEQGKKHGFAQIQIATNGINFARDPGFACRASQAGLNVAYLQFDGLDEDVYKRTRGRELLEIKLQAIDNMFAAGIRTVLVPTIVKGVNDHEIGNILRFAIDNIDQVTGISWQPVAFTGRIDSQSRIEQRFTLADLAREIQDQTGLADMYRDWYPFSFVDPFSRMLESIYDQPQTQLSCSPACGVATYLIVDPETKQAIPIPEFVDVEPLMDALDRAADSTKDRRFLKKLLLAQKLKSMKKYYHQEKGPALWTFESFIDFMTGFAQFKSKYPDNKTRLKLMEQQKYRVLLMAAMHFQDRYNYQLDRNQRCVIQYVAQDGKMYPFCTYNSGPCHRSHVEKDYAIPMEEYRAENRS